MRLYKRVIRAILESNKSRFRQFRVRDCSGYRPEPNARARMSGKPGRFGSLSAGCGNALLKLKAFVMLWHELRCAKLAPASVNSFSSNLYT